MIVRAVFLSIVLAAAPAAAQPLAPDAPPLTLDRAIQLALRHNTTLQNDALDVSKSEDRLASLRAQRLPVFDFSLLESRLLTRLEFQFEEGAFGTFAATGPIPPQDMSIVTPRRWNTLLTGSATQPLSQLYEINLGIRAQKLGGDLVRETSRQHRLTLVNDVTRTYYGMVQTQEAIEAHGASLTLHREVDRLTADYVLRQVALKADGLEARMRLAKAEHERLVLENALVTQQQRLNYLMGRDVTAEFRAVAPAAPPADAADLEPALAEAHAWRPELVSARIRVAQARTERSRKRAEYLPEVSLRLSYLSPFNIELVPKNIVSGGVFVRWQPFDWGRRGRAVAEADKTIEQAENTLRELESAIDLEVRASHRNLRQTYGMLRVTALTSELGREKVRTGTNRFNADSSLLRDLLEAQKGLADADAQHQQALVAYWTALADFDKTIGKEWQ